MASRRVLLPVLATLLLAVPVPAGSQEATPAPPPPPGQPATGPGDAAYVFSHIRATSFARFLEQTQEASYVELGVIYLTNPCRGTLEQGPTARGSVG